MKLLEVAQERLQTITKFVLDQAEEVGIGHGRSFMRILLQAASEPDQTVVHEGFLLARSQFDAGGEIYTKQHSESARCAAQLNSFIEAMRTERLDCPSAVQALDKALELKGALGRFDVVHSYGFAYWALMSELAETAVGGHGDLSVPDEHVLAAKAALVKMGIKIG